MEEAYLNIGSIWRTAWQSEPFYCQKPKAATCRIKSSFTTGVLDVLWADVH